MQAHLFLCRELSRALSGRFCPFLCLFFMLLGGCASDNPDICPDASTPCHPKFYNRAYNRPYTIKGVTYTPQKHYEYAETGTASYYGGRDVFHGRATSNGEIFNKNAITAAHKTIPIPCVVRVTNLENQRTISVKVNDRGPFIEGRIIDVSEKIAKLLGFHHKGVTLVRVETDVEASRRLASSMAGSKSPGKPKRQANTFVDAGGFHTSDKARAFASRLRSRGVVTKVKEVRNLNTIFYQVLVGPYGSVQQAHHAIKNFKGPELRGAKVIKS